MISALFGLGIGAAFGANSIITRRAVLRASANYVSIVAIFVGPFFFVAVSLLTGDLSSLGHYTWKTYLFFALYGAINFALGRTFAYRAVLLIGSTRSNIVTGLNAPITVLAAMVVLQEELTVWAALGLLLTMIGPTLTALKEPTVSPSVGARMAASGRDVDRRTLYVGMLLGLGAAFFWGSSPVFIKLGLENGGTPYAGSLVAFVAASLAIAPSLFKSTTRTELATSDFKCLRLSILSGTTTCVAQMLRYIALVDGSLIIVSLTSRTMPLWVLALAFIFNRSQESFSRWVIIGNSLLMVGTILVVL
ncbi:MAG: DMT family transporter [Chloroflexi bacterium]|nr:DMT family transporter [Chloroflexota bacterium]